jgi:hypothetical protein
MGLSPAPQQAGSSEIPPQPNTSEFANENLKAIKILHQLLMAVTAAILAFALRPDQSQEYKAALDEVAALKQLPYGGWSNFVAERYKTEADQDVKFVRGLVRQASLRVKGSPNVGVPVFGDQMPYPGSRLLDLDAFFSKAQRIGVLNFVPERQLVLEQLAKWKAARNPQAAIIALNLSVNSGTQYPDGSLMLDWLNRSPFATSSFPMYLVTDEQGIQPGFVSLSYTIRSETGPFALEWLRKDTFGQRIVDAKTGVVFPRLKVFWHQINQDGPDQATVFLQEELAANTRGTLSFFGIPVERSLAVSAGPVVTLCILLFMALHLMHFRSLPPDKEVTRKYPWVALFRSWVAGIATYVSLLALPALADAALIYRYGQRGEWSSRIGTAGTLLAISASVWVLLEVYRVRKQSA